MSPSLNPRLWEMAHAPLQEEYWVLQHLPTTCLVTRTSTFISSFQYSPGESRSRMTKTARPLTLFDGTGPCRDSRRVGDLRRPSLDRSAKNAPRMLYRAIHSLGHKQFQQARQAASAGISSGVEKLTWSSLKGLSNSALLLIKWAVCKQISLLWFRSFRSLEKGNFVFQKCLSETPFKPDRVSFCTPNISSPERSTCKKIGNSVRVIRRLQAP